METETGNELTKKQKWLSGKYLAYRFLTSLFFTSAVWLYFYRIFITDQQVGILDGFAFAIGLIAEVPSGALADRFGRDRLAKLGLFLAGLGFLIQAFGSSFLPFFVGQSIMMIGIAFVSGADEALFFENLKFSQKSTNWRRLVAKGSQFVVIATLIATIVGSLLHEINPRIPWILNGIAFVSSAILIWGVKDKRSIGSKNKTSSTLKEYLVSIKDGFMHFRTPKLQPYVFVILTVQGLFYAAGWGLLRLVLLDRFYFSPFWGAVVIVTSSIVTVLILMFMNKNADNLSEKRIISLITLGAIASLLLSVADIGVWGYIVILVLYAGEYILHPFMSEVLNNRTTEKHRATVLSVASFLRMLPYVALAPLIGFLNDNSRLEYFLIGWSVLMAVALVIYLSLKKQDTQVSMVDDYVDVENKTDTISL